MSGRRLLLAALPACVHLLQTVTSFLHVGVAMQAAARGMLARADARRARRLKAALTVQKNMRMLKARAQFLETRAAVLTIQSAWRGHLARSVASEIRYDAAMAASCSYTLLQLDFGAVN